ncbi:MAG: hypothetical protein JST51_09055 [Armatimonadetes bacterium]|nr:hypothetical protein [Armatimonadota bacterium]
MVRSLALLIGLSVAGFASADIVGQWQGIAVLGPSNVAKSLDSDGQVKLQISKAFLKSLSYQFVFKNDKSFASTTKGEDIAPRAGKGKWQMVGNAVTVTFAEENGTKQDRTLKGTVTPDGKKIVFVVDGKAGMPATKLIFKKIEPVAVQSTGR